MLELNYPKKLPAALNFKPMGAFIWYEGSQVLINVSVYTKIKKIFSVRKGKNV